MTLRVLVVTTSYPLETGSSSGIFVSRLVEHLPAQLVRPTVLVPSDDKYRLDLPHIIKLFHYAPRRLEILAHAPGGIPAALRRNRWLFGLVPGFLVSMFVHCLSLGRRADVIHANWAVCGLIAGAAGRLLGKPVVTTLRGEDISRAQKGWLDYLLLWWCLKLNSRIVAVSFAIHGLIAQKFPWAADRTRVIENGVSPDFYSIPNRKTPTESGLLKMLFIGSLIPRKALDQVLLALRLLPPETRVILTVAGEGEERARLEELARHCGVRHRVEFLGHVVPCGIPALLKDSDVLVLASRSEGRPNVILEAMASGLPVIATDIPGVRELVIPSKTGLLFPVDAHDCLAEHIRLMAADIELRQTLGKNARQMLIDKGLTWGSTAEKYLKLYNDMQNTRCAA